MAYPVIFKMFFIFQKKLFKKELVSLIIRLFLYRAQNGGYKASVISSTV